MRPYKLTKNLITQIKKEFTNALDNYTATEGKFSFSFIPKLESKNKYNVYCLPTAYCKMRTLVNNTSSEIAWHMCLNQLNKNTVCITDVLVYPQTVTGTTVNTDDTKYSLWLGDLPDEQFNTLRGQGHSHVNMGVSPSGVDTSYYADLLTNIKKGVYLFMIMNKKGEMFLQLIDIDRNTIYDKQDIIFTISSAQWNENSWYDEQVKMIEKPIKKYIYSYNTEKEKHRLYEGDDWFDRFK